MRGKKKEQKEKSKGLHFMKVFWTWSFCLLSKQQNHSDFVHFAFTNAFPHKYLPELHDPIFTRKSCISLQMCSLWETSLEWFCCWCNQVCCKHYLFSPQYLLSNDSELSCQKVQHGQTWANNPLKPLTAAMKAISYASKAQFISLTADHSFRQIASQTHCSIPTISRVRCEHCSEAMRGSGQCSSKLASTSFHHAIHLLSSDMAKMQARSPESS